MTSLRIAALATSVALASWPLAPSAASQGSDAYVAFRVDGNHAIAVIAVLDDAPKATPQNVSPEPAARYGFPHFDATDAIRARVPEDVRSARDWVVHVAPGQAVRATAERVIGGRAQCQQAAGVLLTIAPDETGPFSAAPAKYFVAEPNPAAGGARAAADTRVAAVQNAALTAPQARQLETLLGDLLNRELPAIRDESAPDIARMMSSDVDYHRAWATARRAAEDELMRGSARLVYDVQGYRLDPRGGTMYFVRAQWHAGGRQAFAAAVWLRGDPLELVEADTSAASWLRMFEFQGRVYTVNLGQVLNVIDRQGDGWGEIIFARGGYESLSLSVRRYSADGFRPEPITFTSGC